MTLSAKLFEQIMTTLKSDPPRDSDHRQSPRVGARSTVLALLPENGQIVQQVLSLRDISATGIGVLAKRPLPANSFFVVQLPRDVGDPMLMRCRVRHCQKIADNLYSIGAQFIKQVSNASVAVEAPVKPLRRP